MRYNVLCITDRSDLPETELFIGLKNAGVNLHVMCNPAGKYFDRLGKAGVTVFEQVIDSRFRLSTISYLKKHFAGYSYDILYCFNNKAASNVLIATRGMDVKIATYRGIVGNISFTSPSSLTTHLHPRVNRIVCVCQAVRDYIVGMKFLWKQVPPHQVVTIYKGHNIDWYRQPPADLSEFNLPENAFVVSFAGRNRPRKGIDYLIDAARYLPADIPIYFLLLGKLDDDEKLRARIAGSPYSDRFILAGFRNNAPAIFAASDALVLPSTEREGLARVVIEAMASETVPVVTNVGGLPELVIDGENGLVIPPMNAEAIAGAIMALYNDPEKTRRMGVAARERIKNDFNTATTVEKTMQMFEDMLLNN